MQWYCPDWRKDPGVQSLSYEERGIWFEMLMVMHETSERGTLTLNGAPMTVEDIASVLGLELICSECSKILANSSKWNPANPITFGELQELSLANAKCRPLSLLHSCFSKTLSKLLAKGVAKIEQNTSKIYNARMVRDEEVKRANELRKEKIREQRRTAGRKGGLAKAKQKPAISSSSLSSSDKRGMSSSRSTARFDEGAREVFEYWQVKCNHPDARFDGDRKAAIVRPLKQGRTVAELKQAVLGCSLTPYNQGHNNKGPNGQGKKFDSVSLIFRNAAHIEEFIATAEQFEQSEREPEHQGAEDPNADIREKIWAGAKKNGNRNGNR
jgi:hypothetical protein